MGKPLQDHFVFKMFFLNKSKCNKMDVRGLNNNPRPTKFEFREEEVGLEVVR